MTKRLFIAIKIDTSNSLLSILESIKHDLHSENIKWVDPHNLHLTLAFLGDTEDTMIDKIIPVMDGISNNSSQFNIELNSLGVFKSFNFPSVISTPYSTSKQTLLFCFNNSNFLPVGAE